MKKIFTTKRIIIAAILLILAALLYFYTTAFMPFILAILTAFMLDPLVRLIQKHLHFKKRLPAVTIAFILFVLFIAFLIYVTITRLINEAIRFAEKFPFYVVEINLFVEDVLDKFNQTVSGFPPLLIEELEAQSRALLQWATELAQQMIPLLVSWAQGIPNLIFIIVVYLIALFLISMELPKYKRGFFNLFQKENAEKVQYMLQRTTRFFTGFFKAQFLVSIIIFVVTYIGLLLITPSNALLMSFIIWFIDFIPFIGSIVVLAPWGVFDLITGDTDTGVKLLILAAILLIIRRTVEPKVMGDQIGLPALPTLAGIWLGINFFGFIGLIIGPLIIIAIYSAKEAGLIKLDFKI